MNKCTTILAAATFAAATITASAATVNNALNAGDPRYMTTGCKYTGALVSGGSIGIWVKNITSYGNGASLFGSCHINGTSYPEQGVLLFVNSAGNFVFRVAGLKNGTVSRNDITAAASSNLRTDGSWHFLLGTFDVASGKSRFYIDGSQVGETDISISSLDSARCFATAVVGTTYEVTSSAKKDNYGAGFVGLFAEATVWNKALSAEEAATLFTRRACPWDDGLIGYWPLAKTGNLAQNATTRTDGSRPDALFYYRETATDADFFDDPPTRFVASAEWVADKGYVQAADATFRNPDAPATNATEAVAAAAAGEKVYLMPGTHRISSQIDLKKANLTVTGKYPGYSGGEAVIDAQSLCRHFRSDSGSSGQSGFVIENLSLENGLASDGGSMYFKERTGVVRNCFFRNNTSASSGGAIHSFIANGTVISNCVFASNSAGAYGGAIYTQQNSNSRDDRCFVIDCVITNNSAQYGGAINADRCINVSGSTFIGNRANTGSNTLGGNARVGIYSTISNCTFTGACQAKYGSCIQIIGSNATVADCDFTGLAPSGFGGALYGVMHINDASGVTFADCIVTNTSLPSNISLFWSERSSESYVASFLARQSLFDATIPVLVANHRGGKSRFENCTILSPTFDYKANTSGQNVLVNCIVPNADITTSGNFVNIITNSLVKSVTGGTQDSGVMTGTPKFVDAANGDYHLAATSPCREKGLLLGWMAGATDLDGNPRLVNLLGKAAADALPDLGCYECQERGELPTVVSFR